MRTEPVPLFRSSGQPGFSAVVAADPAHVVARKLEREVSVRFTPVHCLIQTPEGTVHAKPGDAILTGMADEQWRVSLERFPHKYRPIPPTVAGQPGRYMSLRNQVLALRMHGGFEVQLADGVSHLSGHTGDWLVDYGDGSLGVVTAAIFSQTYEIQA